MDAQMKRFKNIIGRVLSVIVARTRKNEFQFKQLYRRTGNKIKLISVFSFRDKLMSDDFSWNDNLACQTIENQAIIKLGLTNTRHL